MEQPIDDNIRTNGINADIVDNNGRLIHVQHGLITSVGNLDNTTGAVRKNYLYNSNFFLGRWGWTASDWSKIVMNIPTMTLQIDASSSKQSLYTEVYVDSEENAPELYGYVQPMMFSLYVKSVRGKSVVEIFVESETGVFQKQHAYKRVVVDNSAYKRIALGFSTGAVVDKIRLKIECDGAIYTKWWKLEKGTYLTPYSVRPTHYRSTVSTDVAEYTNYTGTTYKTKTLNLRTFSTDVNLVATRRTYRANVSFATQYTTDWSTLIVKSYMPDGTIADYIRYRDLDNLNSSSSIVRFPYLIILDASQNITFKKNHKNSAAYERTTLQINGYYEFI